MNNTSDSMSNMNNSDSNNPSALVSAMSMSKIPIGQNKSPYNELAYKIRKELVEPAYYEDAKTTISGRSLWRKIGNYSEAIGKILHGIAAILAFSAGVFGLNYLSYIAGCISTFSLLLTQFSSYSMKESSERTAEYNRLSAELGSLQLIDIAIDSAVENK
jgi:hypothetical protein